MSLTQHLEALKDVHPQLYEFGRGVVGLFDGLGHQLGISLDKVNQAPPNLVNFSVVGQNGFFDCAIQDHSSPNPGITYYMEYSANPSFLRDSTFVIDMGASRNLHVFLGNATYYWRAYSKYPTSQANTPVIFGGNASPIAVNGGGMQAPLTAPQPSQGSGGGVNGGQPGAGNGVNRQPLLPQNLRLPLR